VKRWAKDGVGQADAAAAVPVALWAMRTGERSFSGGNFSDAVVLTAEEAAACARFLRPEDAELCRAARGLVRRALSAHLRVPPETIALGRDPGGKPRLAGLDPPALRFNLSHARGLVVLAVVADASVEPGIDVEPLDRPVGPGLLGAALAPSEAAALAAMPEPARPAAFLRLWTMKEAVLKAAGIGLAAAPAEVVCRLDPPALSALPHELGEPLDFALLPLAFGMSHVGTLAIRDPARRGVRSLWAAA
jgi:4'-phosphopantetheinyl transferase